MDRERVVFFVDYANINRAARDAGFEFDYRALADYMAEGRFLVESHIFVPIDPRNEHRLDRQIDRLWEAGYVVHSKVGTFAGDTYKCDFDVEITMEVLRTTYTVRPDIIVLATGDSDFIPLMQEVRRSGVRLEIASFERSASRKLRLQASGFISLDVYVGASLENAAAGKQEELEGEPDDKGTPTNAEDTGTPYIPNANDF